MTKKEILGQLKGLKGDFAKEVIALIAKLDNTASMLCEDASKLSKELKAQKELCAGYQAKVNNLSIELDEAERELSSAKHKLTTMTEDRDCFEKALKIRNTELRDLRLRMRIISSAAAEKAAAEKWELSDREKEIIKNLGGERK